MTLQETIRSRVSLLHVRAWQRQRQRAAHWGIVIYTIADLHSRIQSTDVTLVIFTPGAARNIFLHVPFSSLVARLDIINICT
jgi:hypothetical protein